MSTDERDNVPPPDESASADPAAAPAAKRRASDLISGAGPESMGEFGGFIITNPAAVSDAARAVREALGGNLNSASSPRNPQYIQAPPAESKDTACSETEPLPLPPPPPVQLSTRVGDISSQFGKLIIDGLQAMSGAFRKGRAPEENAPVPKQPATAAAQPDFDPRPAGLSDRFSKLIMDKFRAIVDSRWQEKVKPERDSLLRAVDATPNPIVHEEIRRNLDAFERRAQAEKLDAPVVQNTYRSALFLVENPRKQSCLDATERLLLALQIVRLAAYPNQVCSGRFPTADVASVESTIYSLYPSAAAHAVAEVALYGEFRSYSGVHVVLPEDQLHPDVESHDPVGNNGMNRSYASQLLQHVALNIHYAREFRSGEHRSLQAHYRLNPTDNSEELVTADGRRLAIDSSTRSINANELCHDIAGDQMRR